MSNILIITDQPIINKPNVYTSSSNVVCLFAGDINDLKVQASVLRQQQYDMVLVAQTLDDSPAEKRVLAYIEALKELEPDIQVVKYANKY